MCILFINTGPPDYDGATPPVLNGTAYDPPCPYLVPSAKLLQNSWTCLPQVQNTSCFHQNVGELVQVTIIMLCPQTIAYV